MFRHALLLLIAVVAIPGCSSSNANEQEAPKVSNPLSFTMKSLAGKDVDLSKYQGKVVMIVNVASKCGLTPQYSGLVALDRRLQARDRLLDLLDLVRGELLLVLWVIENSLHESDDGLLYWIDASRFGVKK
mgnify:CR=1 FL=1